MESTKQKFSNIFFRIFQIFCIWYMIPLCTGIVEGFIKNELNAMLLTISLLSFPLLAWAFLGYNFTNIYSFYFGEIPELLGIVLLISAIILHLFAFIFSIFFCFSPRNVYWIFVSLYVFFASLRMCEILGGMLGV